MTHKFSRDFLINDLNLPENAIEQTLVDSTRWSLVYEIIFEYEGKFWKTSYSTGATEMRPESPWEYENEIECVEVTQKPVTVLQWVPVNYKKGE